MEQWSIQQGTLAAQWYDHITLVVQDEEERAQKQLADEHDATIGPAWQALARMQGIRGGGYLGCGLSALILELFLENIDVEEAEVTGEHYRRLREILPTDPE